MKLRSAIVGGALSFASIGLVVWLLLSSPGSPFIFSELAAGADGALWVSTHGGLARFHQGAWQVFNTANSELPDDWVYRLAVGADGAVWVGTTEGLARFHEGDWQVFTTANSDLPDDTVWLLAAGADGALWLGTHGALARFHQGDWQVLATDELPAEAF